MNRRFMLMFVAIGAMLFTFSEGLLAFTDLVPITQKVTLRVPYGENAYDLQLQQPQSVNPLQVRYDPAASCPQSPNVKVQVKFVGDNALYDTTFERGGFFRHRGGMIETIRLWVKQNRYQQETCTFQIFGETGGGGGGGGGDNPGDPTYIDTIHYEGGYLHRAAVNLSQPIAVQQFELKVPQFCQNAEVVEAGTMGTGNTFIAATRVGQTGNIYRFTNSLTVNSLVLSINGPKDLKCDIPVYIYIKSK